DEPAGPQRRRNSHQEDDHEPGHGEQISMCTRQSLTVRPRPKTLEGMFCARILLPLVLVSSWSASVHAKRPKPPPPPAAELFAVNTHEKFVLRPDARGRFGKTQLRGFNRFLRCHHTGRSHGMSPRLAALI